MDLRTCLEYLPAPWLLESEEDIPVVVWLKKQHLPDTPRGKTERDMTDQDTHPTMKRNNEKVVDTPTNE